MSGEVSDAVERLIRSATHGLADAALEIMAVSIQECPISGPETYVPQFRQKDGRPVYVGDDPSMVGDAGTLRRSARVFAPRSDGARVTVEMGYGYGEEVNPAGRIAAEYAVPVHERAELAHEPPTKSHFLLDPVLAMEGDFVATVAAEMKDGSAPFPLEVGMGAVLADGVDLGAE